MTMLNSYTFIHYINEQDNNEQVLINVETKEIAIKGGEKEIYAFLYALRYAKMEYVVKDCIFLSKDELETISYSLDFHYDNEQKDYLIDENGDVVIDDIEAFLRGEYDDISSSKGNEQTLKEEKKREMLRKTKLKFYFELDSYAYHFYADNLIVAILSANEAKVDLYLEKNNTRELIFAYQDDYCTNQETLANYNIGIQREQNGNIQLYDKTTNIPYIIPLNDLIDLSNFY